MVQRLRGRAGRGGGRGQEGVEKLIAVDVMVVVAEKSKEERKPKGVGKEGLGGL